MKRLTPYVLALLLCTTSTMGFSQTAAKPKQFNSFPDVINCSEAELSKIFTSSPGLSISLSFSDNFSSLFCSRPHPSPSLPSNIFTPSHPLPLSLSLSILLLPPVPSYLSFFLIFLFFCFYSIVFLYFFLLLFFCLAQVCREAVVRVAHERAHARAGTRYQKI